LANLKEVGRFALLERIGVAEDSFRWLETNKILDYAKLQDLARVLADIGKRVVVTIGTFDLVHPGHLRYLWMAKQQGDILIVGVDSDTAVKRYKGPDRPMVPEEERLEMLLLNSAIVDFVTLIDDVDAEGRWNYELIRTINPAVFVAVEGSYEGQLDDIRQYCGEVVVLPRQAETSTSEKLRQLTKAARSGIPEVLREIALKIEEGEDLTSSAVADMTSHTALGQALAGVQEKRSDGS
jgi:rfaE bifunctional protein nucleotidyltransferase chain/domain